MDMNDLVFTIIPEFQAIELSAQVSNDDPGQAESTDNVLPQEADHVSFGYGDQGFSFNPFGKVIDCHNGILHLAPTLG